ncbi:MAG: 16S rRNA (uracil(1498)-N(3))-methyltransferase [Halioglobus sp.]|nr:16S rRNA (uracil(1498)-N(3))-methyltransferase [Halioglobus sp.]
MNLLLFTARDRVDNDCIELRGRRLRHLLQVHGAGPGDTLRAGEVDGLMGEAEVLSIDRERALLRVSLHAEPPQKLPVALVLALPRPKMLRRILRSAAEFGVRELHLINSYRVEKSYWQTPVLAAATLREYLLQGLEQARDTRLPTVHCHRRFRPWVEDELPGLLAGRDALLAHPGEHPPCPPTLPGGERVLVVGPEGGFIPFEVEKMQAAGCVPVSLGPRILRVENAVSSLLGRFV